MSQATPSLRAFLPPLLQDLSAEAAARVTASATTELFKKGEYLLRENELPVRFRVINAGCVIIEGGGTPLMVAGRGFVLPFRFSQPEPSAVSIVAASAGVCLSFNRSVIVPELAQSPQTLMRLCDRKGQSLGMLQRQVYLNAVFSVEARLAALWWELAEARSDGYRLVPRFVSQATLAKLIGVSREEISKRRGLLERAGYLVQLGSDWAITPHAKLLWLNPE